MLNFWEYIKLAGPIYLSALCVVGWIWFLINNPTAIYAWVTVGIYFSVVITLYCWEHPPKWYCRLKWGWDHYPYFHPKKVPKLQMVLMSLMWPITLYALTIFLIIRDTALVLKIAFDKLKGVLS